MKDQFRASIVRIFATEGDHIIGVIGGGFLVSHEHIITCAHVITQALRVPETLQETPIVNVHLDFPLVAPGELLTARVICWRPVQADTWIPPKNGRDIAVLQLNADIPSIIRPVALAEEDDVWGHTFQAFGFPAGHDQGIWASGVLRKPRADGWIQIEGMKFTGYAVIQGFSGTPVWDEQLNAIAGMVVESDTHEGVKAAFIMPTSQLIEAWPDLWQYTLPPCPYRGLFAFREQDASLFFGRERITQQLITLVRQKALVAVMGASGSGKSSVVFAGLLPKLRSQESWPIVTCRPTDRPFRSLASSFISLIEPKIEGIELLAKTKELSELLHRGEIELRDIVEQIVQKLRTHQLLIIVDQFEELYTLCRDDGERQRFLDTLLTATSPRASKLKVVITLRADFLGYALSYRPFADALQYADLKLGPMTSQELEDAIQKPAQQLHIKIADGLTGRLLEGIKQEPGNLPLLEFALSLLWKKQEGRELTHGAYNAIGGVKKALTAYAEEIYGNLSDEEKQKAMQVLVQLVRPGQGTEDTRRIATRAELGEEQWSIITYLSDARLVVSGLDEATGMETVEVVHEALIQSWERLRKWMETARKFRIWQEQLRTTIAQWENSNRDKDALLRGALLTEAEQWMQQHPDEISKIEKVFIQTSIGERMRQEDTERMRQAKELKTEHSARQRQQYIIGLLGLISILLVIGLLVVLLLNGNLQTTNSNLQTTLQELRQSLPANVKNLHDHGVGSLREAIEQAKDGNVITFAKALSGTIKLSSGELTINKNLIIIGPGAQVLSISGGDASRVFHITVGVGVTITNLTLQDGHDRSQTSDSFSGHGGGIYNEGSLVLINTIVSHNIADGNGAGGGIENSEKGTLILTKTRVSDNTATSAGGIENSGSLTLTSSTITNNIATLNGGGIENQGALTLTNSTVSNNSTHNSGGGISNSRNGAVTLTGSMITYNQADLDGGGIYNSLNATITITSSSISDNRSTFGGGVNSNGRLSSSNSTIARNIAIRGGGIWNESNDVLMLYYCTIYMNTAKESGGGIANANATTNSGGVFLNASILAGNHAGDSASVDVKGLLTLLYPSLIQHASEAQVAFKTNDPAYTFTMQRTFALLDKNPKLGSFQASGGLSVIQTYTLLPESPALNQIPQGAACGTPPYDIDQQGTTRPQGNGCDLGAYELPSTA